MKSIIKLGLSGIKPTDLVAKCSHIENKMTGNPVFADPMPAIADITAAREELINRINAAKMGDRGLIALRKEQEEVVKDLLRKLAGYVKAVANSESEVLSTGMGLARAPEPVTRLSRPVGLDAQRADIKGKVNLDWSPVKGSLHYLVEITTEDPAMSESKWEIVTYTSRSKTEIDSLNPGTYYWFRVKALGRVGQSAYSDPAMVMAA